MLSMIVHSAKRIAALSALSAAFVCFAQPMQAQKFAPPCRQGPLEKNTMGLTIRQCDAPARHELTARDIRKLTAKAETPQDHLRIAAWYTDRADILENQAAGYVEAAAKYREERAPKNMTYPGTSARLEYQAKMFRDEAKKDRSLAASQRQLATATVASTN